MKLKMGSYASRFFLSLFLIICLSISVSAYEIVHYDDFKYTANYTGLVSHGFKNDAGLASCTASYGTEHYLLCYNSVFQYTTQNFNLKDPNYCISANDSYNGGAKNFSIRGKVRGDIVWQPYTSSDTWRMYASQLNGTSDASYYFFNVNNTGLTRSYIYRNAISFTLASHMITYDWYDFQIDYFTRPNGVLSEVYASNITINSVLGGATQYNSLSTPRTFNCINTTRTAFRGAHYLDYIIVLTYATDEIPILLSDPLTDYYSISNNTMPEFSISTKDKYGTSANSVMQSITTKCEAVTSLAELQNENECNPLFFNILASDAENNDISVSLNCGQSEGLTDFYLLNDGFTSDIETLKARYDMIGCNNSKSSFDAFTQGIRFGATDNCSILTSRFSNDYPAENKYLYPNFNIFMDMKFNFKGGNRQMIQFNALDSTSPLILGFAYNSTSNKIFAYEGTSCCVASPVKLYDISMNNQSTITLRILFNKEENKYMFSLENADTSFYSESRSFVWTSPITSMQIYADNINTPFAPVNAGQLFGNFSMFSLDALPAFSAYYIDKPLNCTKTIPGEWQSYVFVTDNVHLNNYLNYEKIGWFTGYPSLSGTLPTDAETQDFLDMLTGGNDFWKLFFGMIIIIVVIVGSAVSLAKLGVDGIMIASISGIAGCFAILVLSFIGIFPVWIPILMIIIVGLIITWILTRPFQTGG